MTMFTGNEGEAITLSEASEWTANYRAADPTGIKAFFYGKAILNSILAQEYCVGIRIYYAIDDDGGKQLVLVGVDASGNDQTSGIVADRGAPCPSYCDTGNSPLLNDSK
ncbi:MAG: hypothetical protein ABIQ40_00550 [Bacteroidia bacterium]